jgi:hypothetical protein
MAAVVEAEAEVVKAIKAQEAVVAPVPGRCITRAMEAVAVAARKCTIAMAAVKCTIVPSMVTAIATDIGAVAFGYTTIMVTTTNHSAGGVTVIGIAATTEA